MIRVAIHDPHPAVRAGLEAILPPDLAPVGTAADRHELWPLLYRTDPDAVLIGAPKTTDALRLCLQVRTRFHARVVVYAPDAGIDTIVPAAFAGAHAVVDTAAPIAELLQALRSPHPLRPPLTPRLQRRTAERLSPVDRAILAMTLAGTPPGEIATTVGLDGAALAARRMAILDGSAVAVGALDGARQLHA
jgi:DNA-binding NarL/FixJ family response regulator